MVAGGGRYISHCLTLEEMSYSNKIHPQATHAHAHTDTGFRHPSLRQLMNRKPARLDERQDWMRQKLAENELPFATSTH
jgi:hypothetical protein